MKRVSGLLCVLLAWVTVAAAQDRMTAEEYIGKYHKMAIEEMKEYGIPASITLAQGLLESGNGNSYLAREANNHFGIKCRSDWTGKSVKRDDDAPNECFRAYPKVEDSYRDHSLFLKNGQRYAFLFEYDPKDYKKWAEGLKKAGYATNPRYPDLLISLIERHELNQYDDGKIRRKPALADKDEQKDKGKAKNRAKAYVYKDIEAYVVQAGDNYGSIADDNRIMRWQIRKYNDLDRKDALQPGTILYLKPKKRKGQSEYHTIAAGESMYYIAQLEGIKLKRLYKLNHMEEGQEAEAGEKLNLRKKRSEAPELSSQAAPATKQALMVAPAVAEPAKDTIKPGTGTEGTPIKPEQKPKEVAGLAQTHTVKAGETPYGIAKRYNISVQQLLDWNDVVAQTAIYEGQVLKVAQPANKPATVAQPKPATAAANTKSGDTYTVQAGETLYGVSRATAVPVDSIKKYNGLTDNALSVGQVLKLKPQLNTVLAPTHDTANNTDAERVHVVQPGETLYAVARQHNVSVADIKQWNSLQTDALSPGQRLVIKKP